MRRRGAGVGVLLAVLAIGGAVAAWRFIPSGPEPPPPEPLTPAEARGQELYQRHCVGCHGEKGDAQGPASAYLKPRPRDFADGVFHFLTTANGVPSDDDLRHVIEDGLSGTGMFAFPQLSAEERDGLVAYVRRLHRQGVAARLRRRAAEHGETLEGEALRRLVARRTEPGPTIRFPEKFPEPTEASVERGGFHYRRLCTSCHGLTGKGEGAPAMQNTDGTPTRPTDLTLGVFKGGADRRQLYARILLGIPGTPMPANPSLEPNEIGDLVNYVLSLSEGVRRGR
jgi:cytochrome c oxidase cbb3-type subunit 2